MAIEKTLFIIKPEAFERREEIKIYISENSDIKITDSRVLVLSKEDIKEIYTGDAGLDLLFAIEEHLLGKEVEVCIAEGEDCIEKMWDLTGKNFIGDKCEPHTVRYVFGRLGKVRYGNIDYYLNAIHKCTPPEADSALKWFYHKTTSSK